MLRYEVTAFTRTGIYTTVVEAEDSVMAIQIASPELRRMTGGGKILRFRARLD